MNGYKQISVEKMIKDIIARRRLLLRLTGDAVTYPTPFRPAFAIILLKTMYKRREKLMAKKGRV
jgi:hypothetical protein